MLLCTVLCTVCYYVLCYVLYVIMYHVMYCMLLCTVLGSVIPIFRTFLKRCVVVLNIEMQFLEGIMVIAHTSSCAV